MNNKNNKKFYITTPIYYVNAKPHIGHTYTTIAVDILARYHRMIGNKTFFLTGTDEHGAKIDEKAKKEGKKPKEFADEISALFQFALDELNISNDNFIRTTNSHHIKAVQKALQHMYDKGDIYLSEYEGLYCIGCEQFKNEKDLVGGECPDHQTKPEKIKEETYMFRMSKYNNELLKKIKSNELLISPVERKNEIINFYKNEGLKDISFSRKNVKWGIPLPWDKFHTAYVWADAFLNYLTGLGWNGETKKYPDMYPPEAQIMSKDILRVHATVWPAMLLSLGLPLPKQLFVHGYFLVDGQKMSKSIGNVIAPEDLIKKYGVDATRYLLISATSFGHDGDISWEKFDEKYNADLANGIGNLLSRTISMTQKYFNGKIPSNLKENDIVVPSEDIKILEKNGIKIKKGCRIKDLINMQLIFYQDYLNEFNLDGALFRIKYSVSVLDKCITDYKPFKLIKEDKEKTAAILYNCLESLRIIALMAWPFIPQTSENIWRSLGLDSGEEMKKKFSELAKWGILKSGNKIKKIELLFPRIGSAKHKS